MPELHCLKCGNNEETRLDLPCSECGARDKWAQPVKKEKPEEKDPLLVNSDATFQATLKIHQKIAEEEGFATDQKGGCPRLSNKRAQNLTRRLREQEAFRIKGFEEAHGVH